MVDARSKVRNSAVVVVVVVFVVVVVALSNDEAGASQKRRLAFLLRSEQDLEREIATDVAVVAKTVPARTRFS